MRIKKIVYKITYPNGKIYIGVDLAYNIRYFGSPCGELIEKDFSIEEQLFFCIQKEILWYTTEDNVTNKEILKKEMEYIRLYESHNPSKGYNRLPKWRPKFKKLNKQ